MSNRKCDLSLISTSDCIEIVRNSIGIENHRVVQYSLEYISEDPMGFLGDYLHLTIFTQNESNNCEEHTYFVKSLPALNGEQDTMRKIFRKEAEIYMAILNTMDTFSRIKWKPDCYLSRPDLIVMEHLILSGHDHAPFDIDLNTAHVKSVLKSLAAMHASSIVYENKTGKNIGAAFKDLLFETSVQRDIEWFNVGVRCLQKIAAIHPKFQSLQYQDFIANQFVAMLEPVFDMVQESPKYRNVVCHRDTWRNNILFVFENNNYLNPVSSTLVDFQFCRYSPPAIDVLLCIYLNLRRSIRQFATQECLKWYHNCLSRELAHFGIDVDDHVSWEVFLKSCDHIKLMPILYNGLAATVIQVPKGVLLEIKQSDPEKYYRYRSVDRTEVTLEIMSKDIEFKSYMFEAVDELIEELLTRNALLANSAVESIL